MSYASRLRVQLDLKQPTSNYGYTGRKVQTPELTRKALGLVGGVSRERIDAEAEKKLLGGMRTSVPIGSKFKARNRKCLVCGILRSSNGYCSDACQDL